MGIQKIKDLSIADLISLLNYLNRGFMEDDKWLLYHAIEKEIKFRQSLLIKAIKENDSAINNQELPKP